MNLYDTPFENKDADWRFGHFAKIAETGIQLCVYCSPDCREYLERFATQYPNIKIMKYVTIQDMWAFKTVQMLRTMGETVELPCRRNMPKDTVEYISMMHSKVEFLQMAIDENPWNSTHFAWIDFNVAYIFKDFVYVQEYLRILSRRTFASDFVAIPGCWEKQKAENTSALLDDICWRFCGGFFIGSKDAIVDFHDKYLTYFPLFVETHRKLIWEVNFWAWLEANCEWSPVWFKGDHNDSIIQISADICSVCLFEDWKTRVAYFYPPVETYQPSSASHVFFGGRHILNTRYVNYWYWDSGHCQILEPRGWIISKNFVSILEDGQEPGLLEPTDYVEMDETTVGLKSHDASFFGLEDIRLYAYGSEIRFICTNINYSPTGRNRMIRGVYDPDLGIYKGCQILQPPNMDSWCEKNWIPIVRSRNDDNDTKTNKELEEWFIYKWWPFEAGQINTATNQLEIKISYMINAPFFMKVRGSTAFILGTPFISTVEGEGVEGLLGLVHFSEETLPRHYYHIMVLLDKDTLQPLKYSEIFCFEKIGIEFCIGFYAEGDNFHFWISRMDREPLYITIEKSRIPLKFDF